MEEGGGEEGGRGGGGRGVRATFRPNVVEIVIYKFKFESTNLNFKILTCFLSDKCSWVPNPQRFKGFSLEVANP